MGPGSLIWGIPFESHEMPKVRHREPERCLVLRQLRHGAGWRGCVSSSPGAEAYVPVRLTVAYEFEEPGPWWQPITNRLLLLVKWLFALPLYIFLVFYAIVAYIAIFISFWVILFTGRFPEGLFNFVRGFVQYQYKVFAYFPLLLTNHWTPDESHPLRVEVDYPDISSRPVMLLLKLPSFLLDIVGTLTGFAFLFLFLIAIPVWFIILVIGRYPRGWFDLSRSMLEWHCRMTAWQYLMRDNAALFGTTTPVKVAVGIGIIGAIVVNIVGLIVQ